MTPSLSSLILLAVLGVLVALPSAFGKSLLTDTELDTFGAGGEGLVHQAEEGDQAFLSDKDLDAITAQGLWRTVWPFQYVPNGIPVFRGFLTYPGKEEGSTVIQFRGSPLRESTPTLLPPQR